jgi:hypothetical protein
MSFIEICFGAFCAFFIVAHFYGAILERQTRKKLEKESKRKAIVEALRSKDYYRVEEVMFEYDDVLTDRERDYLLTKQADFEMKENKRS